ncbi:MAG: LysR family transcriptional regulator [Polyangiales bacterium]
MKLSQVDLNLLVTLDAIIKERSVTRAGRAVGLSQPAMSGALSRLRNLFNDPLLERVGRDYRLTPLAVELAEPVQSILVAIERTLDHGVKFDPAVAQRAFRIAGSDYVACTIFQRLLERVRRVAPGVQLRFQRAGNQTGRRLLSRDIDLSIQPSDFHRDLATQRLFEDRFVCAVWTGNTEVGKQLTEEQFCSLGHVVYSHPPYGLTLVDHFIGLSAQRLHIQAMTDSFVTLPCLLRGTNMVALLQARLAQQLLDSADIRVLPCPLPQRELTLSMWWNPLYDRDAAHAWLRATLVEVADENEPAPILAE